MPKECPRCNNRFKHASNCPLNPENGSFEDFKLNKSPKTKHNDKLQKWVLALKYAEKDENWGMIDRIIEDIKEAKI